MEREFHLPSNGNILILAFEWGGENRMKIRKKRTKEINVTILENISRTQRVCLDYIPPPTEGCKLDTPKPQTKLGPESPMPHLHTCGMALFQKSATSKVKPQSRLKVL